MKYSFRIIFFLLALLTNAVRAQISYSVQQIPYTPYPYATGPLDTNVGTSYNLLNNIDDAYSGVISLGFPFQFFGITYSQLLISTNIYVTFDLTSANSYSPWSISGPIPTINSNTPTNAIMGPWQDLFPGSNPALAGVVGFGTFGTAPYRAFVVSYYNNPYYSCTDSAFTGQIVLHETTNIIDIFIAHKSICPTWNNGIAIEGINNADGTVAYTVPGRNATQWTAYNDGWRFSPCVLSAPADTVSGFVYVDNNQNCTMDSGDQPVVHGIVVADNCVMAYTDSTGFYSLVVDVGTHTLVHSVAEYLTPECPVGNTQTVTFTTAGQSQSNVNFADTLVYTGCVDISVSAGTPYLKVCAQNLYSIYYCNNDSFNASQPLLVDVSVPDSCFIVGSSAPPVSTNGNVYTFSLPYLAAGTCGWFLIIDSVGCDVTVGSTKCLGLHLYGATDCDSLNNFHIDCQPVVSSFDPNAMLVASRHFLQRGYIFGETITNQDSLTYQIDFQNTGTAPADLIVIVDTLPSSLDGSTVESGISSHAYVFSNAGGILTWTFPDINLPDSNSNELMSHGFVRFSVRQTLGNAPGSLIPNRAAIYFDQNLPVLTNYAVDTLESFEIIRSLRHGELRLFPNPSTGFVRVTSEDATPASLFHMCNVLGQTVKTFRMQSNSVTLDMSGLPKGVYILQLTNGNIPVARAPIVLH